MSKRWQLTVEQHTKLKQILVGSKPSFDAAVIDAFLDETGHVVNAWLEEWPPGWNDNDNDDRRALTEFSRHATALIGAYRKMSEKNRYLIAFRAGRFLDDEKGFDYRDVYATAQNIDDLIVDLNIAASERHDPNEGPVKKLPERALCQAIAKLYSRKFGRAPSANSLGSFGKFINHLTENLLPPDRQMTIGSDLLRFAANVGAPKSTVL